jgi:hypothetical protein
VIDPLSHNRALGGTTMGLTALSPILPDTNERSPRAELAAVLAAMPNGAESPLARVSATHSARWVIVQRLPYFGLPASPDSLKSAYLLFTSNFDGTFDDYLASLVAAMPDTIQAIWRHCVGFPGAVALDTFRDYIVRCQVPTTFLFGAYPSTSCPDVLRALAAQKALREFVLANQGKAAADVQRAFRQFRADLASAPTPAPGTL